MSENDHGWPVEEDTLILAPDPSMEFRAQLNRTIHRLEAKLAETEVRLQELEVTSGHLARLRRLEDQIDRCATSGCPSCHHFILDYKGVRGG